MITRSFFSIILLVTLVSGCSSFGINSEEKLLTTVAFDKDCPVEKVKVVNSVNVGFGEGDFKVEACGKKYRYMYTGSVYLEIK